jgi:hypothetical protein
MAHFRTIFCIHLTKLRRNAKADSEYSAGVRNGYLLVMNLYHYCYTNLRCKREGNGKSVTYSV